MPASPSTLVIGCGNLLCGDDAVGPEVIRRLTDRGVPAGLACLDAATAGIAAIEAMRGFDRVILVDACAAAAPPGTLVELTGDELVSASAGRPLCLHAVRWIDALPLAGQLLGAARPARCDAWLVAGTAFGPGDPLTPAVDAAIDRLVGRLVSLPASAAPPTTVA